MPILSKPSAAARTALIYITLGALTVVWSVIWYVYLRNSTDVKPATWYFCSGFMLTGLTFLVIGMALGRIGRAARHAELPPPEVTRVEANATQNAAARAPIVAPVNPAMPAVPVTNQAIPVGQRPGPAAVPASQPVANGNAPNPPVPPV